MSTVTGYTHTEWFITGKIIVSQFWRPEVSNQDIDRAMLFQVSKGEPVFASFFFFSNFILFLNFT